MFDICLQTLFKSNTFRYSSKLTQAVETFTQYRKYATDRYASHGNVSSKGLILLQNLLNNAFINEEILPEKNLQRRYFNCIEPVVPAIQRIIDPVYNHTVRKLDYFVKSNESIHKEEYFLPVSVRNPYRMIPFTRDWNIWKKARPLRLMNVSSSAITYNIQNDWLQYKTAPKISVFTVDIALLIMQFSVYVETHDVDISMMDTPTYLHQNVIFPCLSRDPLNLWLLRNYLDIMDNISEVNDPNRDYQDTTILQGRLGSRYSTFYDEMSKYMKELKAGNTRIDTLFNTLPFQNNITAFKLFQHLHNNVTFPNLIQYKPLDFLTYQLWYNLLIKMVIASPVMKNNDMKTPLVRDVQILMMNRFFRNSNVLTSSTKKYIYDNFLTLYNDVLKI